MNEQAFDIIIIGAGIVGAACAREFAQEGMKVAVVDVNSVGSGATAAGMGHVVVMDDSEAQFALGHLSQQLWTSFAKKLLSASEYHCCGTIWVAADDEEMGEVERKKAFYQARGVASEILSSTTLYQAEPHLRQGLAGGLLIPGDNAVYPPFIAQYFIEEAANKGAMLLIGKKATQLISETVILEDGSELYAPIIVNACGSWSPTLTTQLKIKPRKGHLLITERYPGFVKHQLIELGYIKSAASLETDSVAFNVQPRMTGQILLGSSRQFDEDPQVDSEILAKMVTRAGEYMPSILELTVTRVWTGFRATPEDKLPIIGPSPWQSGVYLATGHEGLGITTSLGTARLLMDQILNRPSAIPIEPYLPTRLFEGKTNA